MAFPTLLTPAHSHETSNVTSTVVALPDGSDVVGRLVVVHATKDGTGAFTFPAGWTSLVGLASAGARVDVRYRIIDGTEGFDGIGDTITLTHALEKTNITVHTYSVWHGTTPPEASSTSGATGDPDPPSLTPSWATDDTAWAAGFGADLESIVTGFPTSYDSNQHGDSSASGAGSATHGIATRELNAASDDPGVFTRDVSDDWVAYTVAVRPSAPPDPAAAVLNFRAPVPTLVTLPAPPAAILQVVAPTVTLDLATPDVPIAEIEFVALVPTIVVPPLDVPIAILRFGASAPLSPSHPGGGSGGEGGAGGSGEIGGVGSFNAIRSPYGAGGLGGVFHTITHDGNSHTPSIDGWEAAEEGSGGYMGARGRIPESIVRRHADVYVPRAVWQTFHRETNEIVHVSRLEDPAIEGGVAELTGVGAGERLPEREFDRVWYQSRDTTEWKEHSDDSAKWEVEQENTPIDAADPGVWSWHRQGHTDTDTDEGPSIILWVPGQELTRAAFRCQISGPPGTRKADIHVYARKMHHYEWVEAHSVTLGPSGGTEVLEVEVDFRYRFDGNPYPSALPDNTGGIPWEDESPDAVRIQIGDSNANVTGHVSVDIMGLRVNGWGLSDRMTDGQLVRDIADRIGVHSIIEDAGINILPYAPGHVAVGEVLDYAELLSGVPWRFVDFGAGSVLVYGEGERYAVADGRQPFRPVPLPRYDRIIVPFRHTGYRQLDGVRVRLDPSPLEDPVTYGRIPIEDALPFDQEQASELGERLLQKMSIERTAGDGHLLEVRDQNGARRSGFLLHSADVLDHPLAGSSDMRIRTLRKTYGGVEYALEDELSSLERILARRAKRLERRIRN
jgi:hypothetical protein